MKKITYPAFYRFPARYTFALLTLAGSGSVAMADGKISMDAFSLAPGQTVTVAVNLDQTGDIYGLQANVALPNGLKLVEAKADKERVEDKIHTFQYKKNGDSYIFLITPDKSYPIYGNSGMLFELTLQAEDNFFGGDIQFSNVVLSNTSAEKTVQDDFSVSVSLTDFTVGDFSVAADLLTITENGGPYMVELSLDNKIPVKGLQGTISLPEGLSIKKDSKGYPIFINGERLTESASLDYNEKNGRFVLIDQTSTDFWGYCGVLFSFEVVPDESKLAKTSEIALGSFTISTANNASVDFNQQLVVTVDNSAYFKAGFEKFLTDIEAVRQDCQDAMETLQNHYKDVAADYLPQLEELLANLDEEKNRIGQEQEAGKSPSEVVLNLEPYTESITKILADAKAAQSNIIYTAYEAKVKELKQSFEDTKAYISTYLPDVAAQFEEQLAGIAQNIESFSTIMAEAKAAGKPAMELQFGTEEFAAVDEQLAALLDDAKAAQSNFTYAAYEAKIAELQQSFADTKSYIDTYLPDVAAQFAAQLEGIAQNIANFSSIMAEAKAAGKPAMELQFGMDEFAAVDEQLAALLEEAKAAQSDFIYANYEATLKELAAAYAAVEQELKENYADIAASFDERMAAVAENLAMLTDALAEAKQQHVPGMDLQFGAAEFKMVADEIAAILEEAKDKQNLLSYDGMEQLILKLQKSCAEAIDYVKTQCPDADRVYAARLDNYKHEIMDWAGIFATGKAHNTPIDELGFTPQVYDELKAKIQTALDDAKNAQSEYLYGAFETKLAELSANCADTKAYIETFLPNVAGQYAATMEKAAQDIKNFENTIKNFKAAGKLALDLTFGMADLEAVDQQMKDVLEEAKSAESAYLYTEFDKALAQLATDLADTKEALNNYPDVKAGFAGRMADVEATLAEVKAFIEESKAAGTSAMELTTAKEALQAMDAELANILAEAKAAQSEYLYAEFDKALAQLATDLADTKEALNNYPDVKDNFAERMAAVEAALAEVKAFIEESKAAGADATDLTSAKEAIQAMEAELAAIQAEAKATQEEYTALYADYTAQVDEVQAALEETVKYIENECADVADNYKDRAEEIQAMIDAVKADVEAAKTSGNLFDFVFSVADIKTAIDEMLQAAIDEQQTVGIGLIELDGEQSVRIYSTSGVQSDKVIKGKVNIVRMPDGTVKKIFVK